ncbi:hypothetical protein [Xanthomonas sp. XNM01]|uniref:hypothetical protein n=1 Tax=Xanthomonas sp. XNM01 TaxID=2769289 RepID=UPI0031BAFD0E
MPIWSPTAAISASAADLRPDPGHGPDPLIERVLRRLLLAGLAAVLLVPALRGSSDWLGWMPLWLVGMPLAAWWALHRFRLPPALARILRRRSQARRGAQARRLPA